MGRIAKQQPSPTPALGSQAAPVNAQFAGPDDQGTLYDVPPDVGHGPRPLAAVNGIDAPKLGTGVTASPKTKG